MTKPRLSRWTALTALGLFALLTTGCGGCVIAGLVGETYWNNRVAFNECFTVARDSGKGHEVAQGLREVEKSLEDWQAFAGQLKEWGLEDDCAAALEAVKQAAKETGGSP